MKTVIFLLISIGRISWILCQQGSCPFSDQQDTHFQRRCGTFENGSDWSSIKTNLSRKAEVKDLPLKILMMVPVATQNFAERFFIRSTWAQTLWPESRVVFYIGTPQKKSPWPHIMESEREMFKDIVVLNLPENAQGSKKFNINRGKTLQMFKHAANHFSAYDYFAKVDSDTYPNWPVILKNIPENETYLYFGAQHRSATYSKCANGQFYLLSKKVADLVAGSRYVQNHQVGIEDISLCSWVHQVEKENHISVALVFGSVEERAKKQGKWVNAWMHLQAEWIHFNGSKVESYFECALGTCTGQHNLTMTTSQPIAADLERMGAYDPKFLNSETNSTCNMHNKTDDLLFLVSSKFDDLQGRLKIRSDLLHLKDIAVIFIVKPERQMPKVWKHLLLFENENYHDIFYLDHTSSCADTLCDFIYIFKDLNHAGVIPRHVSFISSAKYYHKKALVAAQSFSSKQAVPSVFTVLWIANKIPDVITTPLCSSTEPGFFVLSVELVQRLQFIVESAQDNNTVLSFCQLLDEYDRFERCTSITREYIKLTPV